MATPIEVTLIAAPIVNFVITKLTSKVWGELKSLWKVDTRNLERRLSTIMEVLEDSESGRRLVVAEGTALYKWLNKLKDAAYDADDVVDEYHTEALRLLKTMGKNLLPRMEDKVRDFFSSYNTFLFRHDMNKKLKEVMKTLDEIMKDGQWILLSSRSVSAESLDHGRETSSVLIASNIYGRDADREKVVNYLIYENNDLNISVLSIVGLGGIGKTTLAQLVYREINREFDPKLWVWVSTQFSVESILRKVIEGITKQNCNLSQIEVMHQKLKGLLSGKRFLLILDDVWIEDVRQWRHLQSLLGVGRKGSKILVTTRTLQVAHMIGSTFIHQLKGLSNDDCWELFSNWAFGRGRAEKTPRLEEMGKEIASKCGGLPLAAEALGSLLGTTEGQTQLLSVQNNEIWRLPEKKTKILSDLKLSYHRMPSHLKQCFTYCSLFPKSHKFVKEKLINLWFVEGFIPSLAEGMPDNSCLDRLIEMNFIQDAEEYYDGLEVVCKMHDVVQDLAWSVAGDEFLFVAGNNRTFKNTYSKSSYRYLSLISDSSSLDTLTTSQERESLNPSVEIDKVRSLISLPRDSDPRCNLREGDWEMLLKLSLLRVLDLSSTSISELPDAISKLKRLRLINLSNTDIRKLPVTITNLHCLLTLNLAYCRKLQELPSGVSNLSNLRHLDVYNCESLTHMPARIGRLNKLLSLTMFVVGRIDGHTIQELQHMNMIRGRLQIKDLQNLKGRTEAEAANLQANVDLRQLELYWKGDCENVEDVFEGLQPCQGIEVLKICGYKGIRLPSWISACSETRLRELSIINCRASSLHSLSNGLRCFSSLKKLKISSCEDLTCLPDSLIQQHISSLKILDISENKNLISLGGEGEQEAPIFFTSLNDLILGKCKSLVQLPGWLDRLISLNSLDLSGCRKLGGLQQLKALDRISIALCQDLDRRYREEIGENCNMALIRVTEETQQGGEHELGNSRRRKGSSSNFLRHLGLTNCMCGNAVHD